MLESGKGSLGGEHWTGPFAQDPIGRKRKVAPVPPPQPPVGVAVVRRGREGAAGAAPSSCSSRVESQDQAAPVRSDECQGPPQALGRRSTAPKAAVRKVAKQKHHQHPKGGTEKTITPFSWRAGKELSDKVLSVLKQMDSAKQPDQSPHSLKSSIASQPNSSQGGVGISEFSISCHQPSADVKHSPSHHLPVEVDAAMLLADMDQDPSEDEAAGERVEPRQQQAKSVRRGRRKVTEPPKRPKYNFGKLACCGAADQ